MKTANSTSGTGPGRLWVALLLGAVLILLFARSFIPDLVHFSNDGPLGAQNADFLRLPAGFSGMWDDLNTLGLASGAFPPSIGTVVRWALGPVGFAKFLVPITMWILGMCAWFAFRRLGLAPVTALLGAVAVALNSVFFSTACWGVASQIIGIGMNYLALGLVVSSATATDPRKRWARLALAGFCVGMSIMEGLDNGALFSVVIAAFVVFCSLTNTGTPAVRMFRGVGRTAVVAIFAAFIAAHTISSLITTQLKGIAGTGQDAQSKAEHWDWATQWSLPKREMLGLVVPGVFGYRMDSPDGGNYWGAMGRDPAWDRFFESDKTGPTPAGVMRFSGGGLYSGVPVVLVALWAALQSFRKQNSVFTLPERQRLWFWIGVSLISTLLAFGRFAPFYHLVYQLPYFSTIRNPVKFIAIFIFALTILFAYGVDGLWRKYMATAMANTLPLADRLKNWWAKACAFDKRWMVGCGLALGASLLGWLIYASSRPALEQYLQTVQFNDKDLAHSIAEFSIRQVGWFVLLLVLGAGLMLLILSGWFAGARARWGAILLGGLLLVDLGRADQPWIKYWDYPQKYATNPVLELLRDKPYEHRVAILPFRAPDQFHMFYDLYRIEWAQHHFPYYNIQSLDIVQMPRTPEDLAAFEGALSFDSSSATSMSNTIHRITRRWELTNTRYLLGPAGFVEVLNQELDPRGHRFRIAALFDVAAKPGIANPTRLEEMTAISTTNGPYALLEFTGALPRAKLYTNWQVRTNDAAALTQLAGKDFDPVQTVLVANPVPAPAPPAATNQAAGTVTFANYAPKDIVLKANAAAPAILLLNDKYDPNWQVLVDGRPAPLLRCNFIMRGVQLTPGTHTVEFRFQLPMRPFYVSLAGIVIALGLIGFLFAVRNEAEPTPEPSPGSPPAQAPSGRKPAKAQP